MKIIHCGLMAQGRTNEGLSGAFQKAASKFAEVKLNKHSANKIRELFVPDILFLQIHNSEVDGVNSRLLFGDLIKDLESKGTKVVNWNGDIRRIPPMWMKGLGLTAFTNMRDIKAMGGKFLQIGIDPEVFKRWSNFRNDDVVFMGNNYGNQFPMGQYRREACKVIKSLGGKLYGNYDGSIENLNADPKNPFPRQSKESRIYSECGIAISISHFDEERYTSDRLLRCMGSGAFTLSYHYKGIEQDFTQGVHLDTFRSHKEMIDKIQYYKEHKDLRNKIAEEGYKHIHANFTYDNMVQNIIEL